MIDKNKLVGASLVALAIALTGSAALADRSDRMGGPGGRMFEMDFAALDADKDGKVTAAEMTAYHAAQVAAIDTDGDGLLSAEELAAMHVRAATARAADHAARMISERDADGDGKLSVAEMANRPMPARLFQRLDADNDGAISEAEFAAAKDRMGEARGAKRGDKRGWHQGQKGHHGNRGNN